MGAAACPPPGVTSRLAANIWLAKAREVRERPSVAVIDSGGWGEFHRGGSGGLSSQQQKQEVS